MSLIKKTLKNQPKLKESCNTALNKTNVSVVSMNKSKEREDKIKDALRSSPHGAWVREVSRKTGIDKITVSRYLESMGNEIEFEYFGRNKVFRLK